MAEIALTWQGQNVLVACPDDVVEDIHKLFGRLVVPAGAADRTITITLEGGRFAIDDGGGESITDLTRGDLATFLMDVVIRALITDQKQGVALHAGAVARDGRVILVAGASGSGKSSLICWLVDNGFEYLTDEIVLLEPDRASVTGLARALVVKPGSAEHILKMRAFRDVAAVAGGTHLMFEPPASAASHEPLPVALVIYPDFARGADLSLAGLSSAASAMKLVECNLNARNFRDGGFAAVTRLARAAPALALRYGDYEQLAGRLDVLFGLASDGKHDAETIRRFLTAFTSPQRGGASATSAPASKPRQMPQATPLKSAHKALTIGMATYDDYDGVFFTLQALRMYHADALDDVEFLVIDNHPTGPCADALKSLEGASPDYRYVPMSERTGTMVRQRIVEEGRGDFILVMDCHVLLWPGALARLRRHMTEHADTRDLLQGPLVYDGLDKVASHFRPEWRQGMYGTWDHDPRAEDIDAPPFDIPMQGLGLYAFRRAAWPGFNPRFRGFGGEEGYIHEKFRRAGGRTLCLPFLRWLHRFQRPMGLPYSNKWDDRIRNYIIGLDELGQSTEAMEAHFIDLLGRNVAVPLIEAMKVDVAASKCEVGSA